MINFKEVTRSDFLNQYWQKKPLIIRNALPDFVAPLTPDELAGLALEDDIESRIVRHTPDHPPSWHLKRGPFKAKDFKALPVTNWTLLVQGVDRIVPEVAELTRHFKFIPQWRFDDVMISYAAEHGTVGPHYDNYDVFLFQARGRRKWSLTSKQCTPDNCLSGVALRIMAEFDIEDEFVLEEGDMLYLPPHIGHYGVSLSDDCMTYSFGYRSYQAQEMWDSFGEYLSEQQAPPILYRDPNWHDITSSGQIADDAIAAARTALSAFLDDPSQLQAWFGRFVTQLDGAAEALLLAEEEVLPLSADEFINRLKQSDGMQQPLLARFAYYEQADGALQLFINGESVAIDGVTKELVSLIVNHRVIAIGQLTPFLTNQQDLLLLHRLYDTNSLVFIGENLTNFNV